MGFGIAIKFCARRVRHRNQGPQRFTSAAVYEKISSLLWISFVEEELITQAEG